MTTWEYKYKYYSFNKNLINEMNEEGKLGWETIQFFPYETGTRVYFKRQLS